MVTRLLDKTAGEIVFKEENIGDVPAARFNSHRMRRDIQIVFQDPHESLNPRYTAFDSIAHRSGRWKGSHRGENWIGVSGNAPTGWGCRLNC